MKFPENADIEEYKKVLQLGALKGAAVGLMAGFGAAFYLKRRTSFFVGAGGFQKVLVFGAPVGFCTIVNMELTSRSFEDQQRQKKHGLTPQTAVHKDAALWDRLSLWANANKYKIIVAGWAASLGGSFWLVNRDRYMTKAQKIVQARVYAQGLTVALLLGSVFLSVTDKQTDKQKATAQSRSWERDIQFVETANHPHGVLASKEELAASKAAEAELHAHPKKNHGPKSSTNTTSSTSSKADVSDAQQAQQANQTEQKTQQTEQPQQTK